MTLLDGRAPGAGELEALALTNYGHFTTFRVEGGGVRGLSLHLDRLARDCRALFDAPLDLDAVRGWARQEAGGRDVAVRVTVFDSGLELARPLATGRPQVLVTSRAAGRPGPLRVCCVPHERDMPEVKSVALFATLRLRRVAQQKGFDDALFVDRDGLIGEGGTWNAGFVDAAGAVVWPLGDHLSGITMRLLGEHRTAPLTRADLGAMAAAFATNAVTGIRPIARIDDVALDPAHRTLRELAAAYEAVPGEAL